MLDVCIRASIDRRVVVRFDVDNLRGDDAIIVAIQYVPAYGMETVAGVRCKEAVVALFFFADLWRS
jgi:hypothetical protein